MGIADEEERDYIHAHLSCEQNIPIIFVNCVSAIDSRETLTRDLFPLPSGSPYLLTIPPTHSTMHCYEYKVIKVDYLCLRTSPTV